MRVYIYLIVLVPSVAGNIDWKTESNSSFVSFTCIGSGDNGTWHKIINGSYELLAYFNSTSISVTDEGQKYTISVHSKSKSKQMYGTRAGRTTSHQLISKLTTKESDHGGYKCTIGGETHLFHIKMKLMVSSSQGLYSLQVSCTPPTTVSPPFTTLWFLNSTFVSTVFIYSNKTISVSYKNTSFVDHKNFTYNPETNSGYYNGTQPACLSCILSTNNSYGDATRCTLNTRDLSSGTETGSSFFQKFVDMGNIEEPPLGTGGTNLLIITITLVAAIICAVFIIHVKGKTVKLSYKPTARIYKKYGIGTNADEITPTI